MSEATSGFFKGFFNKGAQVVGDRKAVAEDFYAKQVAAATQYAYGKKNKTTGAQTQVLGKLKAAGVPDDVLRSMINQDPDDLERIYDDVTKMQAEGVKEVGPEFWNTLNEAKTEVAPQRKYSEFISENREGIVNNYKASGDGAGSIWATLMGHNAMERASARLEDTMIGDKSAAEWLSESQQGESYEFGADLNYGAVGDALNQPDDEALDTPELMRLAGNFKDVWERAGADARLAMSGVEGSESWDEDQHAEYIRSYQLQDLAGKLEAAGADPRDAVRIMAVYDQNNVDTAVADPASRPAEVPDFPGSRDDMVVGNRYWHPTHGVIRKNSAGEVEKVE
jgi:hypothetical protein